MSLPPPHDSSRIKCAGFLRAAFDPVLLRQRIAKAKAAILKWEGSKRGHGISALVVTGTSGTTFGAVLAHEMGRHLVVIRKKSDSDHASQHSVEGLNGAYNWLFVDDLIASGTTFRHVRKLMEKYRPEAVLRGVYTYAEDTWDCAESEASLATVDWINDPSSAERREAKERENAEWRARQQVRTVECAEGWRL